MAEKEEDRSVCLDISSREKIPSLVCRLNVPNFFTLPEYDGAVFKSPTFWFAGANWFFEFESEDAEDEDAEDEDAEDEDEEDEDAEDEDAEDEDDIRFDVYLVRLNSVIQQEILSKVTFLDANDQEFDCTFKTRLFKEDENKFRIAWFSNDDDPSYDRRETLCLIIQLFCEKLTVSEEDETQNTANGGIQRLAQNMKSLLQNGQGSDVILKVEDNEFRVHKGILMARSPVFAPMFQHDTKENTTGIVDIPDCSAAAFEVFLSYLYTGSADVLTSKNVSDVFYAADKYQVNDLKSDCVEFIEDNLSVDNFCEVMTLSSQHSETGLQEKAIKFFCDNVKKIIRTVQWQKYVGDYPTQANELYIKAIDA